MGQLLLSTGRPGLSLWVSDDLGLTWHATNLGAEHNSKLPVNSTNRFSEAFVAGAIQGPGQAESTAYTTLARSEDGAGAIVCYDRLVNG